MSYWCCAQLDGRRERWALYHLDRAGYRVYQPLIRGPRRTSAPLFPGYVFVLIELQWSQARWAIGVRRLIQNGGAGPAHVPNHIIDELHAREDRNGLIRLPPAPGLEPAPQFKSGDQVRICAGPLSGFVGLVEGLRSNQKIEVLLTMLGGLQRVELAVAGVRPA